MPGASPVVLVLKNSPAKAGDAGGELSVPRSGRSPEDMATHSGILS